MEGVVKIISGVVIGAIAVGVVGFAAIHNGKGARKRVD